MKKFYLGERTNPQLKKPYYKAYGKLTKREAEKKEDCLYGSMLLMSFEKEDEYLAKIEELKNKTLVLCKEKQND